MSLYKFLLVTILATAVNSKLVAREIHPESAASKTQIKFAEENNYDQTGPGAKEPEGAFKTYKTLEDVLIGYLDDPDTKLPESERKKAYYQYAEKHSFLASPIQALETTENLYREPTKIPTSVGEIPILIQPINKYGNKKYYLNPPTNLDTFANIGAFDFENFAKIHKINKRLRNGNISYRARPIVMNVAATPRKPIDTTNEQIHQEIPQYTYSYGVHDRMTGDSKSVHETRSGGSVLGFYTVLDPDGQQRTVRYTADDKNGFKAIVERTPVNRGPS